MQISIRDSWDKSDAPIQRARRNLKEILGVDVTIDPQWQPLLAELDSHYSDKSTFVPTVAGCVMALLIGLSALLEDENNAKWADELVENVGRSLKVFLEVRSA